MTDRNTNDRDLGIDGANDRIEGGANQVGGRIRRAVGTLTGDKSEQAEGGAQELKGKLQDGLGKAKQAIDRNTTRRDEV